MFSSCALDFRDVPVSFVFYLDVPLPFLIVCDIEESSKNKGFITRLIAALMRSLFT